MRGGEDTQCVGLSRCTRHRTWGSCMQSCTLALPAIPQLLGVKFWIKNHPFLFLWAHSMVLRSYFWLSTQESFLWCSGDHMGFMDWPGVALPAVLWVCPHPESTSLRGLSKLSTRILNVWFFFYYPSKCYTSENYWENTNRFIKNSWLFVLVTFRSMKNLVILQSWNSFS